MKIFELFTSFVTCGGVYFENLLPTDVIASSKAWSTIKLFLGIIFTYPANIRLEADVLRMSWRRLLSSSSADAFKMSWSRRLTYTYKSFARQIIAGKMFAN